MNDLDSVLKRTLILSLVIGSVNFLGIPLIVQAFWPEHSSLPPEVLSVPLQGAFLTVIFGRWVIVEWKKHHYGLALCAGCMLLVNLGLMVVMLNKHL